MDEKEVEKKEDIKKIEEIKKEEPKKVEPKKEEIKKIETKKEEIKKPEPKKEEPKYKKVEQPKKNTKKNKSTMIIIVALVVILIVVAVGYFVITQTGPKGAVNGMLTAIKNGDDQKLKEYTNAESMANETGILSNNSSKELQKLLFEKLSWEILNSKENNDNATVEIKTTNKDMKPVMTNYMQKAMQSALKGEEISAEKVSNLLVEELKKENAQTKTTTQTITLKKENGKWMVQPDEAVANAILPGFSEALDLLQ